MSSFELYEKARKRLEREVGGAVVDRAAPVRFVLAFPNTYSVGMSSLGYQLVYQMLNGLEKSSCERVFLPDSEDMSEYIRSRTELFALESQSPLSQFDVVAFSVSFEMDYVNVLEMLKLAGLPIASKNRDETRPLVIAGGPCATFNPEPLAPFIDAFIIGDAEELLSDLVGVVEANRDRSRNELLAELARIPGIYVPAFYVPQYDKENRLIKMKNKPPAPEKVQRVVARDLSDYCNRSFIRTPEAEFGEIELAEISRGCGRQCRFCVAGYVTRPVRPRELQDLEPGVRKGLVGAAVFDHPYAETICRSIVDAGGEFTVSSVRLETVTPALAKLMAAGGQKTLTIAPEAGSDRLRRVINKPATEEQMFMAVASAQEAGLARVKMYFMIGLPTETEEDVQAIINLTERISSKFPDIGFHVSVSCFVPKPWTPFQWHPMDKEKVLKKKYAELKKGILAVKGVDFGGESPRMASIQSLLTR